MLQEDFVTKDSVEGFDSDGFTSVTGNMNVVLQLPGVLERSIGLLILETPASDTAVD